MRPTVGCVLALGVALLLAQASPAAAGARMLSAIFDPVLTGFDGKPFHHDVAGDFNLLEDGAGWKIDASFVGDKAKEGGKDKEVSWTREVRVFSPNGDMVSCSLPSIRADKLSVQMRGVAAADGAETVLSPSGRRAVHFGQMRADAIVSEGTSPAFRACHISTPNLEITVSQIFGQEQAAKHPETEAWAAPFIWLDISINVLGPLPTPVAGLLSVGYPEYIAAEAAQRAKQAPLRANSDALAEPATLAVEGKDPPTTAGAASRRLLALGETTTAFQPITLSVGGF